MKLWNPKEKKEKKKKIVGKPHLLRQVEVAQKKKIVIIKRKCRQFCPNIFVQLSLSFSLQFGEIVFWRGRRENWWVPPKSLIFSTFNQTTKNIIFSPLFSPSFSILPKITPNKHSLKQLLVSPFFVSFLFFFSSSSSSSSLAFLFLYSISVSLPFLSSSFSSSLAYFFWLKIKTEEISDNVGVSWRLSQWWCGCLNSIVLKPGPSD